MKHFLKSSLLIIFSLLCGICHFSEPTFAASFSLTASSKQVSPGATFTVSVGGSCVGRVNIKVSGGTIPKDKTAVWVEENYQTITVTAGSSGAVTVTATPETGFSDPDGNDYNPSSRSVSVAIVAPTPPTTKPTTPTPPASTNQTKPSTNSKPSTPSNSNNQTPGSAPADSEKDEANQPTEDGSDKSNDETSGSISDSSIEDSANENENQAEEDQNEPDACVKARTSAIIAWIVAGIFGILFLGTLIVLIYILRKNHPTTTSEKPARPSAKAKNQKSNAEHKSKEV